MGEGVGEVDADAAAADDRHARRFAEAGFERLDVVDDVRPLGPGDVDPPWEDPAGEDDAVQIG